MPTIKLPRGIQQVSWKNKVDKTIQVRYRVRINRKDYQHDQYYDDLKEAEEALSLSKTKQGVELLRKKALEELQRQSLDLSFMQEPTLSYYINEYVKKFIDSKEQETYLQKRNVQSLKTFYQTIIETEIEYRHDKRFASLKGILSMSMIHPKKALGKFKISEIGIPEINDYIRTRLATEHKAVRKKQEVEFKYLGKIPESDRPKRYVKKSSVAREISLFSVFYREIGEIDKALEGCENVALKYNKKLLAEANKKRLFRLKEEDEKRLFDELAITRNKQMGQIVMLSLLTSCRRSEIVTLLWEQVGETHLHLFTTKNRKERFVFLTPEAKALISTIERREGDPRVFSYKISGFEGSFSKLKERIGLKHIRMHDMRRESIARFIEKIGQENSIYIAQMLGFQSATKFEEQHVKPMPVKGINSQGELMKHVGHANLQETYGYYNSKSTPVLQYQTPNTQAIVKVTINPLAGTIKKD